MVKSIIELIQTVKTVYKSWDTQSPAWFRGEPESSTPLLPKLYRAGPKTYNENLLIQRFRAMGPSYGSGLPVPPREENDLWLYIMQHVGALTRLLDWSEGLLQALYFALQEDKPLVWMINPNQLNALSGFRPADPREFPIPWGNEHSPAQMNVQAAFRLDKGGNEYPVCFIPTYIHPRMAVQRSTFTVHGTSKVSIASIDGLSHLSKYDIDPAERVEMISELRLLGISRRSLFPDYDGLAKDLLP